jgi:hypothetical protein
MPSREKKRKEKRKIFVRIKKHEREKEYKRKGYISKNKETQK